MIIYKDCITDDELLTDIYKMKLINDCVYEVVGKLVTESRDVDDALLGANASAEETADGVESNSVSGVNVVIANRLVETGYGSKKEYQTYIKDYMKRVLAYLEKNDPDAVGCFKKNIQVFMKTVLSEFGEYQFFMGSSCDCDGMIILMKFVNDVPHLYFFKHGLIEEKV